MRYFAIVEYLNGMYSAYVPDVPYCIAVAETQSLAVEHIKEALQQWGEQQDFPPKYPPANTVAVEIWIGDGVKPM